LTNPKEQLEFLFRYQINDKLNLRIPSQVSGKMNHLIIDKLKKTRQQIK